MSENAATMQVESKLGAMFIVLFVAFMVGLLFLAMKNFNSDAIAFNSNQTQVKTISSTERQLIAQWILGNDIDLPEGEGYRYIERKYPNKPWLKY